jgi:hypothetical protein
VPPPADSIRPTAHSICRMSLRMATPQQKVFCVLEFVRTNSVVTVQRAFRRRFHNVLYRPSPKNIRRWFQQLQDTGCLCKGKSPGRPRTSEENVRRIQEAFQRSPRKSISKASHELQKSGTTIWRILKRRLHMNP